MRTQGASEEVCVVVWRERVRERKERGREGGRSEEEKGKREGGKKERDK